MNKEPSIMAGWTVGMGLSMEASYLPEKLAQTTVI
jgi:hypothetical protein